MSASNLGIPKLVPVTASFLAPLTLAQVLLSLNVVRVRLATNTFQGNAAKGSSSSELPADAVTQPDGHKYDPILISSRIHGNFTENTPLVLLLAAAAELNGADRRYLAGVLATYCVLRASHVVGLGQGVLPARALGFFGTNGLQLGMAGWVAYLVKGYWG